MRSGICGAARNTNPRMGAAGCSEPAYSIFIQQSNQSMKIENLMKATQK